MGRRIISFFISNNRDLEPSFAEFVWNVLCGCEHNGETGFKQLVVCSMKLQLHLVAYDSRRKRDKGMSVRAFCLCHFATLMQL